MIFFRYTLQVQQIKNKKEKEEEEEEEESVNNILLGNDSKLVF